MMRHQIAHQTSPLLHLPARSQLRAAIFSMNKHIENAWVITKIICLLVMTVMATAAFSTAINKALSPSEVEPECRVTQKDQFGFEHEIEGLTQFNKKGSDASALAGVTSH